MKSSALVRFALACIPLVALAGCQSQRNKTPDARADTRTDAAQKLSMWKVSSPTATLYLVGSLGFGNDAMYPLPKEIESAFDRSTQLIVEVDDTKIPEDKMTQLMMKKAYYDGDKKLSNSISKQTRADLVQSIKAQEMHLHGIEQMKAALVATLVLRTAVENAGMAYDKDIDDHFVAKAKKANKPVAELENFERQYAMVMDMPDDAQEKLLKVCIAEAKTAKTDLPRLIDAWKRGDSKAMASMSINRYPEMADFHKKIVAEQNTPWTGKLVDALNGKDQSIAVISVENLLGDDGVLRQLEKQNFKVEQVAPSR